MPTDSRQAGFSLLEVLVAFVVLAAALGAALPLLGQGLRAAEAVDRRITALMLAESRLAELAASPVPGDSAGQAAGGYRWHARVADYAPGAAGLDAREPVVRLVRIEVSVGWAGGRPGEEVRLATLRALPGGGG